MGKIISSYAPGTIAETWAAVRGVYTDDVLNTIGLRTGFGWYDSTSYPGFFDTDAHFYGQMIAEGFFTGSFPYKFYTPAQAAALGQVAILHLLVTEGFTVGDLTINMVTHSPGETDAQILAALRAQGYIAGGGIVVMPQTDKNTLTDSVIAEGNANLTPLTTTYVDIPGATLNITPTKSGYVMVWAKVKFSDTHTSQGDQLVAQLVVGGAAQSFVITHYTVSCTTGISIAPVFDAIGLYRIAVSAFVAYTIKLQAKHIGTTEGSVLAGSQIMAWWVAS